MGYAKQLGKSYNADTAWSSLGTDLSAYERSELANTFAPFREISTPGYSEYSLSGPRRFQEEGNFLDPMSAYIRTKNQFRGLGNDSLYGFTLGNGVFGMPNVLGPYMGTGVEQKIAGKYKLG
jgi:hypothetical protein